MIRLKFSDGGKATQVLTFDGEVLEIFDGIYMPRNPRIHISLVESMEIQTDRKGKHKLVTKVAYSFYVQDFVIRDDQLEAVQRLIAQVFEAKAAFRFD